MLFTPYHKPDSRERLHLNISDNDNRKIKRGGTWKAVVTDTDTGIVYTVQGADCGSGGCFCAAEVIKRELNGKEI